MNLPGTELLITFKDKRNLIQSLKEFSLKNSLYALVVKEPYTNRTLTIEKLCLKIGMKKLLSSKRYGEISIFSKNYSKAEEDRLTKYYQSSNKSSNYPQNPPQPTLEHIVNGLALATNSYKLSYDFSQHNKGFNKRKNAIIVYESENICAFYTPSNSKELKNLGYIEFYSATKIIESYFL